MKNKLPYSTFLLILFLFTNRANANTSAIATTEDYFSGFDESEIYTSFAPIDDLITYMAENENVAYSDLEASHSQLLSLVNTEAALALTTDDDKFMFTKQTAYFMGCAFGMLGILAVAIINNGDNSVVTSSIWGFVTSGCVTVGLSIAFYVWYIALFSGFYY
jgi:hypothetical protein